QSVGDSEVQLSVLIEIRYNHGERMSADTKAGGSSESAVAITKKNGDDAVSEVHDRQVGFPVAIEIRDGNGNRTRAQADGRAGRRPESSVSFTIAAGVAQKNADGGVVRIRHG